MANVSDKGWILQSLERSVSGLDEGKLVLWSQTEKNFREAAFNEQEKPSNQQPHKIGVKS